jgi:hypothetical protein
MTKPSILSADMRNPAILSVQLPEGLNLFELNSNQCKESPRNNFTLVINVRRHGSLSCKGFVRLVRSINNVVGEWGCQYTSSRTTNEFTLQIQSPTAGMVLKIMGLLSDLGRDCFNDSSSGFTMNGYKACSASVVLQEQV